MADHVHRQIITALAAALTGLTTSGANVFTERPEERPLQAAELPALRVYPGEESGAISEHGVVRTRACGLAVVIEACVKASIDAVDTIDAMCIEVEVELDVGVPLGGLAQMIEPRAFEYDSSADADLPVAVGRTTYEIIYHTAQGAPDVPL
jgi:hypothetical protein